MNPLAEQAKEARRWPRLAFLGALYYMIVYVVAGNTAYERQIVWLGAALLGLILAPLVVRHVRQSGLPKEGKLLLLFLLWSMTGYFVATDGFKFIRYLQLLTELTLIVIGITLILQYAGSAKWFHLAFLGVSVAAVLSIGQPIAMSSLSDVDPVRLEMEAANALGFVGAMGLLGALALLPEFKRIWMRSAVVVGGLMSFYAVILSASRTAFLAAMVIAIMWPMFCLASAARYRLTTVLTTIVVFVMIYWAYEYVVQKTYMGTRFMKSVYMEDGSTQVRFELALIGLEIFAKNPLFGCGLGGFGVVSGTGYYAHNEFIEIAATMGLPGLVLYYSMYAVAWRRLSRSLQRLQDPLARYRANVARVALLVLVVTGLVSTPNFLSKPSMFLLATAVGIAHWAERMARQGVLADAEVRGLPNVPADLMPAGWPTAPAEAAGWGSLRAAGDWK